MEAHLNGSSGIPLKCSNCEKTGHIEWICLKCNSQLHDFCIAAHRTENPQLTHSIIPNFDAHSKAAQSQPLLGSRQFEYVTDTDAVLTIRPLGESIIKHSEEHLPFTVHRLDQYYVFTTLNEPVHQRYNCNYVTRVPIGKKLDAQPAADLVKVTGSGVANGVLSTFDSRFTVNTNGAGFGELGVRIRGPTGAFAFDMSRESEDKKKINCKYDATETGQYVITVTWSDDEVPGSPFTVHLVKTQDELDKLNLPQKDEITKL